MVLSKRRQLLLLVVALGLVAFLIVYHGYWGRKHITGSEEPPSEEPPTGGPDTLPATLPVTLPVTLIEAVSTGDVKAVARLLAAGADPNGDAARRPLLWAVYRCDDAIVKRLLEAGADPAIKDDQGRDIFAVCRNAVWLKLMLGKSVSQLEKDKALVIAEIDRYAGKMFDRKRRMPHWGQGLIGYHRGQAFFWTNGMGAKVDGVRLGHGGIEAAKLLRKQGAGTDPNSPIWAGIPQRGEDRLGRLFNTGPVGSAAVWQDGDKKRLVCFSGMLSPLMRLHCFVFDEALRLVAVGECRRDTLKRYVFGYRGWQGAWPYALVEYRSRSGLIPQNMQGRWMLGVALVGVAKKRDVSQPLRLVTYMGSSESDAAGQNVAFVAPIDLYGHDVDLRAFEHTLGDLDDIEIRFAERGHRFAQKTQRPKNPGSVGASKEEKDLSKTKESPAIKKRSRIREPIIARNNRLRRSGKAHLFWIADPGGIHSLAVFLSARLPGDREDPIFSVGTSLFVYADVDDEAFGSGSQWPGRSRFGSRFKKGVRWRREGGERLVVADIRWGFPLGTAGAFAFDKDRKIVAVGEYPTNLDSPDSYALVEFRTSDSRLPKAMRAKWMLAMAAPSWWQKLDPKKPVVFGVWPTAVPDIKPKKGSDLSDDNRVRIYPIDWYNDGADYRAIDIPMTEIRDLEIRLAEPGPLPQKKTETPKKTDSGDSQ